MAKAIATGRAASNAAASPPHITVSAPLIAPRLPPETGASTKRDARARRRRGELARDRRRGGGVVDEDRAALHAGEGAVVAERDRAQVVVVADAGEHDLGALGRRGAAWPRSCRRIPRPMPGLGGGAVVDGHARGRRAPGGRPSDSPSRPGRGRRRGATGSGRRLLVLMKEKRPRERPFVEVAGDAPFYTMCRCSVPAVRSPLRARWLCSLICRRRSFTESALRSASS